MNEAKVIKLLTESNITPHGFTPSKDFHKTPCIAVFADTTPVVLCGPSDDKISIDLACNLATCESMKKIIYKDFGCCDVGVGIYSYERGTQDFYISISSSNEGSMESVDDVLCVIVGVDNHLVVAAAMCVDRDIQQVFKAAQAHI